MFEKILFTICYVISAVIIQKLNERKAEAIMKKSEKPK